MGILTPSLVWPYSIKPTSQSAKASLTDVHLETCGPSQTTLNAKTKTHGKNIALDSHPPTTTKDFGPLPPPVDNLTKKHRLLTDKA